MNTTHRRDAAAEPAYRAPEAAHILGLPASTIKAWCFGHDYAHKDGSRKRFAKVIAIADDEQKLLSFENLCELHLLGVIRRRHRIKLQQVRKAVQYMGEQLGQERPLLSGRFRTNGVHLFAEHAGVLLNVSAQGQRALQEDFDEALARIEFADSDRPVRLFPFTRITGPTADQPKVIVIDPVRSFGRPVLTDIYVRTQVIEDRFQAGDSLAEMAADYGAAVADIEEALRFEQRRAA